MLIRDVMTSFVVTAPPDARVTEVAELMRERNVGSVVLLGGRADAVGIVTDRDLTVSVLADGRDGDDRIEDHASAPVITARLDMNVEEAAELMVANGIRRLPIVDGHRLTGIVTLDDIVLRTQHPEATLRMTTDITRAALPEFYFFDRGG